MKRIFCIPLIVLFQVAFAKKYYVFGMMGFSYAKAFEIKNHNGQVIAKGVGLTPRADCIKFNECITLFGD